MMKPLQDSMERFYRGNNKMQSITLWNDPNLREYARKSKDTLAPRAQFHCSRYTNNASAKNGRNSPYKQVSRKLGKAVRFKIMVDKTVYAKCGHND